MELPPLGFTPEELEFVAEHDLLYIIPKRKMQKLSLICVCGEGSRGIASHLKHHRGNLDRSFLRGVRTFRSGWRWR